MNCASPAQAHTHSRRLTCSLTTLSPSQEVLDYIRESLEEMKLPKPPADEVGANLFRLLDLTTMHHDVLLRVKDMNKLLDGAQNKVHILQMMTTAIDKSTVEETVKSIDTQFNSLVSASAAEQRSSASLEVMNVSAVGVGSAVC